MTRWGLRGRWWWAAVVRVRVQRPASQPSYRRAVQYSVRRADGRAAFESVVRRSSSGSQCGGLEWWHVGSGVPRAFAGCRVVASAVAVFNVGARPSPEMTMRHGGGACGDGGGGRRSCRFVGAAGRPSAPARHTGAGRYPVRRADGARAFESVVPAQAGTQCNGRMGTGCACNASGLPRPWWLRWSWVSGLAFAGMTSRWGLRGRWWWAAVVQVRGRCNWRSQPSSGKATAVDGHGRLVRRTGAGRYPVQRADGARAFESVVPAQAVLPSAAGGCGTRCGVPGRGGLPRPWWLRWSRFPGFAGMTNQVGLAGAVVVGGGRCRSYGERCSPPQSVVPARPVPSAAGGGARGVACPGVTAPAVVAAVVVVLWIPAFAGMTRGLQGTVVVGGGRAGSWALQRPGVPVRRTSAGRCQCSGWMGHGVWRAQAFAGCPAVVAAVVVVSGFRPFAE